MERTEQPAHMAPLRSLEPVAIRWLAGHTKPRSFAVGERLIGQDEEDRDCYFLVSGRVDVFRDGEHVASCGAGDPEGELALLYRGPRSATVVAVEPVETLVLPAADFDAMEGSETGAALSQALRAFLGKRFGHPSAERD